MTKKIGNSAIPAATILLLRDRPAFEVLLIERHVDIEFAGGALVFPGGRIDPGDVAGKWRGHAKGLDGFAPDIATAAIAAIREAFEETGILVAYDENGELISGEHMAQYADWRGAVEAGDGKFLELITTQGLCLACDRLTPFAHWAPPEGFHNKRFDTWFFACQSPPGQAVSADGGEATDALWIEPSEALKARERQERSIIFPTARNLELLALSDNAASAIEFAAERTIRQVQPEVIDRGGEKFLTIPDDLGYPVTEESVAKALRSSSK